MINLFLDSGYLDIDSIVKAGYPFTIIVGARGVGKTYGVLTWSVDHRKKIILMRRTQSIIDLLKTEEFSPYKSINEDQGREIRLKSINKYSSGIYDDQNGGELLGYTAALSTFTNIRGFDASDVDILYYDEFIPEKHDRPIKGEAEAFLNAYETVNRNRELKGMKPVQAVLTANANRADNPIFVYLGLVSIMERMKRQHKTIYRDDRRGILLINVEASPISEQKNQTALYRLTSGSDFQKMATENEFAFDDFGQIGARDLREFNPLVSIGELTIYRHKSRKEYYCCQHESGSPDHYGASEREIEAFQGRYWRLYNYYLDGFVWFSAYIDKVLFLKYIKG